jgi:phosphoribosyl-AMP cyclohydrolase / phosphoribosyl-ATP pyrophosphohydrolase
MTGMSPDLDLTKVKFDKLGLVPAIIQDAGSGKVLMLGYMNLDSLQISIDTKRATFWSRNRSEIWVKGQTSGNFLEILNMQIDCDSDALLLQVKPAGPTCHTGSISCFQGDAV